MHTTVEFLKDLRDRGVTVSLDRDKLRCSAPAGVLTAERRQELADRKAEIVDFLRTEGAQNGASTPVSFAQERMWLIEQLNPGHPSLNLPLSLRLRGHLQREAIERSVDEIVRRHDTLRTSFVVEDGRPAPVVVNNVGRVLEVIDLGSLPETARDEEAHRAATELTRTPFDLTRAPLMRCLLVRLDDTDHLLHFVFHHIICDGWSLTVLSRELTALYNAYVAGLGSPLPALALQYADYAHWQRSSQRQAQLAEHRDYWHRRLLNSPTLLELPTDFARGPIRSFQSGRVSGCLPEDLVAALRRIGQQEGATLFITVLAAFTALLSRHAGQHDVCVGFPEAGRTHEGVDTLIGVFSNHLVLRTDLSGNPTFRELLVRVKAGSLEAQMHKDIPLEQILETLPLERSRSHTPLFQVALNMLSFGVAQPQLSGLTVESFSVPEADAHFDLTLYLFERHGLLETSLVYNVDLFTAERARWLLTQFRTLLDGVVEDPGRRVGQLSLLGSQQRLAQSSNPVRAPRDFVPFAAADVEQSIPLRFEQQVTLHPQRIAVRTQTQTWTYAQLDELADRIAGEIVSETGAGDGQVALLFGHGAPMIAAILGTLKAGKTYVPLDPTHPPARLSQILDDSQAGAILTDAGGFRTAVGFPGEVRVINIDGMEAESDKRRQPSAVSADGLAYILYTSGSTGRPKGVMQSHRNVLRHIRNYTNALRISPHDRLTLLSSYGFDASVMAIFGALLNGAAIHPFDVREEGIAPLSRWLATEGITIYHSTPTLYEHFVGSLANDEQCSGIRIVVLGGEEVRHGHVAHFKRHFPSQAILVNGLGPTESTLALQNFITHQTEITGQTVPVGYPVDDVEVRLLDENGMDAEVFGEIALRSPQVALGYWRDPDMTNARFFTDSADPARRVYRTGDLGRLRPDGLIEFAGRKDFQVKIRGVRVEPGEVEALLARHPDVRDAVVVSRETEGRPGDTHLSAYVIWNSGTGSASDLRAFLKQRLPDYMVPSTFMALDAFPMTPNGKLDRQALPVAERHQTDTPSVPVAPRTAVEEALLNIWRSVLGRDAFGIRDNFFDLGGHSLLASQLVSRVRNTFHIALPVQALFEMPSVEQMATLIERGVTPAGGSPVVTLRPGATELPLFLVHGLGGGVWDYRELARLMKPDRPVYGLVAKGISGEEEPLTAIEDIAAHCVGAMKSVQASGPYAIGGYCFGGVVAVEMARQLEMTGERVALLGVLEGYAPLKQHRRFRMAYALNFIRNLPFWLSANVSGGRTLLFARVRRVTRLLSKLVARRAGIQVDIVLEDALDNTTHVLPPQRRLMESQIQAQLNFMPKACASPVTLIRVRGQSLWWSHDPTLGWSALTSGGVVVRTVEGSHHTMLEPPHVCQIAEQLEATLERVSAGRLDPVGA